MKIKGVTARAISTLKKECEKEFSSLGITSKEAFVKPAKSLGRIECSGRTLRKVFQGEYVQEFTIRNLIKNLGLKQCIYNGKIDIENEQ